MRKGRKPKVRETFQYNLLGVSGHDDKNPYTSDVPLVFGDKIEYKGKPLWILGAEGCPCNCLWTTTSPP